MIFTVITIALGVLSFFRPIIGIVSLIILESSFVIPTAYSKVSFGFTGTGSGTIIILCLFFRTIISYKFKSINKFDAQLLFTLILWLFASASLAFILDQSNKKDLISVVLQTAVFYILPLAVSTLSTKERKILASITALLAVSFSLIHLGILWTKSGRLVAQYYFLPIGMNDAYEVSQNIATSSGMFYIPRASGLIMITTAFLAGSVLLKSYKNLLGLFCLLVSLGICLVCSISFAQRSFVLVLPIVITIFLGISFKRQGFVATIIAMVMLVGVGYAVIKKAASQTNYTAVMEKRLVQATKLGNFDPRGARVAANREALTTIAKSPLWGIGSIVSGTKSQDAHSLLRVGLMGGLPAIVLVVVWLSTQFIRFIRMFKKYSEPSLVLCLSAFCAVMFACMMMMLNTVPYIFYSMYLVPFGIYIGIFISEYTDMMNSNVVER